MANASGQAYRSRSDSSYAGYGSAYRRRRSKSDWAGVGLGDAFKSNLDHFARMPAQRLFYQACKRIQIAAATQTGDTVASGFQPKTKPQLGPCYTGYPSTLAVYAAVGLTGFLEFETRASAKTLHIHLAAYLKNPAAQDNVEAAPNVYQKLAEIVTQTVQTRLLLEEFSRVPALALVELYRLFSAAQQHLKFDSLPEIVNAVILYGDILPDWQQRTLHPLTFSVLQALDGACRPFFDKLATAKPNKLVPLGVNWVRAVCICLAKFLPRAEPEAKNQKTREQPKPDLLVSQPPACEPPSQFASPQTHPPGTDKIAPLNGPNPPALFDSPSAAEQAAMSLLGKESTKDRGDAGEKVPDEKSIMETLQSFSSAVNKAGGQETKWEDMRSDLVERVLRSTGFGESPIQGNPTDGHEVQVRLGKDKLVGGEIHDRPVELSDDLPAYEKLLEQSQPVTEALKRTLYPSLEELTEAERFRTNGALDPARLGLAEFSPVIFKRNRVHEIPDRRGQPVLLIACDGSGSLSARQMLMLKILAAAWLNSTVKSRIQVIAGLYHSGLIRQGVSGPLIQWIYHPHKTPATSRQEAARAVVSLPDDGTGAQSDALSLAFMLEEARGLARGRMVYLILISDCEWNRSFATEQTGKEEVFTLFQESYDEFPDKLHTTLVALGVAGKTGFEELLDKVITVPEDKLEDGAAVAEQIAVYVASCMKERHKLIGKF